MGFLVPCPLSPMKRDLSPLLASSESFAKRAQNASLLLFDQMSFLRVSRLPLFCSWRPTKQIVVVAQ
jgi:hypothetical protein